METVVRNTLPIFNFSPEDLPGEIWKPVYEFEKFALISQFGRVKRTSRILYSTKGARRYYPERIYKPTVKATIAYSESVYRYQLICTVSAYKLKYIFNVMRMVYYLFNREFPFHDPDYSVVPVDGNYLHIHPENLRLIYSPDSKTNCVRTRPKFSLEKKMQLFNKATYSKEVMYRKGLISCYSKAGTRICTFENIYKAHIQTKISVGDLEQAIAQPFTVLQECYWRSGKGNSIDTALIHLKEQQIEKEEKGIQLTQFDLCGNPINHYYSINDATADNHLSESDLLDCLHGKSMVAGYFLWRRGYWDTPIPGL